MKYMLMIYTEVPETMDPAAGEQMMAAYWAYNEMLQSRGAFVAGEALHPVSTATTVRVRDGQTLTTDGPFAETKEQLGGYYVVEAKDLDEAIEFASKIPNALDGTIEIRPLVVFG